MLFSLTDDIKYVGQKNEITVDIKGISLNGKPMIPNKSYKIVDGDTLTGFQNKEIKSGDLQWEFSVCD